YYLAIPYLEKSLDSVNDVTKKADLYNYLSLSYSRVDRIKSVNYLKKGLDILNTREPISDSVGLVQKARILFNLALVYSSSQQSIDQLQLSISYIDSAIKTIGRIRASGDNEMHLKAVFLTENGKQYAKIGDTINALNNYQGAVDILEKLFSAKPGQYSFDLSAAYYNLS